MRMHPPATEDQIYHGAGWSSPVARQAHNLKVVGSNPTPATNTPIPQTAALRNSRTVHRTGRRSVVSPGL